MTTNTDAEDGEQYDERTRQDRTDIGASAQVEITRGTGTRDQEKYRLKGKGEDAQQAMAELAEMLEDVVGQVDDRPLADQIRAFDPEGDDDD